MKLFVASCSMGDYTNVDKVYGEYLAEKLNCEYVHEARGCGSNWRMWRVITNHILNDNLTSDDLLIVQYTTIERCEFWCRHKDGCDNNKEEYGNGEIIKYKINAHIWQPIKEKKSFFKLYENNFLSDDYNDDVFNTQHLMFQSLLKEYNISTIFFGDNFKLDSFFEKYRFEVSFDELSKIDNFYISDVDHHYSQFGHMCISNYLYHFIKNKKII